MALWPATGAGVAAMVAWPTFRGQNIYEVTFEFFYPGDFTRFFLNFSLLSPCGQSKGLGSNHLFLLCPLFWENVLQNIASSHSCLGGISRIRLFM